MKKTEFKPYADALAETFDHLIQEGEGFKIFAQSENNIDVMEGSPAEYLEEITGKKLSEEMHGNCLYSWGSLSELNKCIEGDPVVEEEMIYSYTTSGFTGSCTSFKVIQLLDDHYITMSEGGETYYFFRIEINAEEVDLSRFIVDYDTFNAGKIRNQMMSMDATQVEMDTRYVKPDRLEQEYRELLNELYNNPRFKSRISEFFREAFEGYTSEHFEKYLEPKELDGLAKELKKGPEEMNVGKLADLYFKIVFAKYR